MIAYKNILEVGDETQEKGRGGRNSPRIRAGLRDQSDITPERHRRWLDSLAGKSDVNSVRIAFSDGVPFGLINLREIDMGVSSCDWGFYIGDDNFLWRKLGQRLIYDVLNWGFAETEVGVNKMYSAVRSDNLKVLYRHMQAGSHIEGFLQDHMRAASGELLGIYLIAQFRSEWHKNKEKIFSWSQIGG